MPTVDGKGRVCAIEILNVSPTVAQYIEEGRTGQIYTAIKEGGPQWKMQTMNMALEKYYTAGKITEEKALEYAGIRSELRQMLRRSDAVQGVTPALTPPHRSKQRAQNLGALFCRYSVSYVRSYKGWVIAHCQSILYFPIGCGSNPLWELWTYNDGHVVVSDRYASYDDKLR